MATHERVVDDLKRLLKQHPEWKHDLKHSLALARDLSLKGGVRGADGLPVSIGGARGYYAYLDRFVRWIPTEDYAKEVYHMLCEFYWLLDQEPGRALQTNTGFKQWMDEFAFEWGRFLDTPASAAHLQSFYDDPAYHISDYQKNPSGYLTFNQFFARELKSGKRPIAGDADEAVVVSPADCTFKAKYDIDENSDIVSTNSHITVKHTHRYGVTDLLDDSPYMYDFSGGLFIHSFLGPSDYHRFHAPVAGRVKEARVIPGDVYLDVSIQDGAYDAADGTGYQFSQTRGLVVIESEVGLVAVLPIGMAQVSSTTLVADEGALLAKGEEFGYFTFGGSDIIVMFQKDRVTLDHLDLGTEYYMGMEIARAT